jgi:hypothetical protein
MDTNVGSGGASVAVRFCSAETLRGWRCGRAGPWLINQVVDLDGATLHADHGFWSNAVRRPGTDSEASVSAEDI